MDSLLFLGDKDQKVSAMLTRMGYAVISPPQHTPLPQVLQDHVIDLVLLDVDQEASVPEVLAFLRDNEETKKTPIVVINATLDIGSAVRAQSYEKIEVLDRNYSVGTLLSKVATLLRLRKLAGTDEKSASLAEMNAALRDLTARFKRELDEARSIQNSLLPQTLPGDQRFEVAVSYQPLEELGGDWYYIKTEPNGGISLQIADVTGHGLSAALLGSMTKLAMSAANKLIPNELLQEVNRLMAPQLPQGRFVTMASYLYDPATGKLDFARAGHPPGLLLKRKMNQVVQLKGDGFPIGFFEEGEYTREAAEMEVNDILILLTDGIPEAQDRSRKAYGYDRTAGVMLASKPSDTVVSVLEAVLTDFDQYLDGRKLKDDVTILGLKRLA
jgi:sigma-B regulation protein RsbU (phosphoserine phosphatase)